MLQNTVCFKACLWNRFSLTFWASKNTYFWNPFGRVLDRGWVPRPRGPNPKGLVIGSQKPPRVPRSLMSSAVMWRRSFLCSQNMSWATYERIIKIHTRKGRINNYRSQFFQRSFVHSSTVPMRTAFRRIPFDHWPLYVWGFLLKVPWPNHRFGGPS